MNGSRSHYGMGAEPLGAKTKGKKTQFTRTHAESSAPRIPRLFTTFGLGRGSGPGGVAAHSAV